MTIIFKVTAPGTKVIIGVSCRDGTSASIGPVLLLVCLVGHMANMSSLTLTFPHIELLVMKTVILLDLKVKTNI